MSTTEEAPVVGELMVDPRLERLLTVAKEINDLLVKINTATSYLSAPDGDGGQEEVEIARTQLTRDLAREFAEAEELLPSLDEIISRIEREERDLDSARKISLGLAKIEGLGGTGKQERFLDNAKALGTRISELENLVDALEALEGDLRAARRSPRSCPRCTGTDISYRLTPSELGFTIYKCEGCGNSWRITSFTLRSAPEG